MSASHIQVGVSLIPIPTSVVDDAAVDAAYSKMCDEIDRWELVGPMRAVPSGEVRHGKPVMVEPWMVRPAMPPIVILETESDTVQYQQFKDKAHAVAFVQWSGLKAALNQFAAQATIGQGSDTPDSAEQPSA